MVTVKFVAYPILGGITDTENRWFTIETTPITDDPATWPHKSLFVPNITDQVYSRINELPPGRNTIWVGISKDPATAWEFSILVFAVITNQQIARIHDVRGPGSGRVAQWTIDFPDITLFTPIQEMLKTALPLMMQMMGVIMMIRMMVSLMGGMMVSFAGGV
jgi:hypothetical protein